VLSFGILAALWASSSAVVAISDALNRAYDVQEGRPWWKVRGMALMLTIGLSLFIVAAMVLLIFGPQLGDCWHHWKSPVPRRSRGRDWRSFYVVFPTQSAHRLGAVHAAVAAW
jgi:uncharacterized BrkB/YihY/UPF0761 family membrane protein